MKPSRLLVASALACALIAGTGCATRNPHNTISREAEFEAYPVRAVIVPFKDERGFVDTFNKSITYIPILGLWGGYVTDRADEKNKGSEPYPKMIATDLAKRLEDAKVFSEVVVADPDAMPEKGSYDVLINGNIRALRAKGGITRFGLSLIGDVLWEIGLPYYSRRWEVDVDYTFTNGYSGEQIGATYTSKLTTTRTLFTAFYTGSKPKDLARKLVVSYDGFIDNSWKALPAANDVAWVSIKEDGRKLLAAQAFETEQAKRGSPPVFSFLAPANGSIERAPTTTLRYSIAAPGALKSAIVAANNQLVDLGLDAISLGQADTAPTSVPAKEIQLPLRIGVNKIEAAVADHRGNGTRAAIEVTRYPAVLNPQNRYALLIGQGSAEAQASVARLQATMTSPYKGQFAADSVTAISSSTMTRPAIEDALRTFGTRPLDGELAVIYLSCEGKAGDLTIAGTDLSLDQFVDTARKSLATTEVVFLADIAWAGSAASDANVAALLPSLPQRWAFLPSQRKIAPTLATDGMPVFASAIESVYENKSGETRLTLERFIDAISAETEAKSQSKMTPRYAGRYNPAITMLEKE